MYRQSEKNLLSINTSSTCQHNLVNFPLAAENVSLVWGTLAYFNGFRVLAALLHDTLMASAILRRSTVGATYIRQGDHQVGHWPTFLVSSCFFLLFYFPRLISSIGDWMSTIPTHIRSLDKLSTFKRQLKSHLFQSTFAA